MRPIQSEMARATILSSLEPVHRVVLFDDLTPVKLIEAIVPDLLVKGGDYQISQIVGADFVTAHGGEVKTFPLIEGFSTTQSVEKIKQIS